MILLTVDSCIRKLYIKLSPVIAINRSVGHIRAVCSRLYVNSKGALLSNILCDLLQKKVFLTEETLQECLNEVKDDWVRSYSLEYGFKCIGHTIIYHLI